MSELIIGPKPKIAKKKPDGYHTFSVRVKQETVDKLDEMTFPFAQAGTGIGGDQPIQERLGIGMKHHPVDRLKVKGIIV